MSHFLLKIKRDFDFFLSFIADERCLGCRKEIGFICNACYKKIRFNRTFCKICAYPLPENSANLTCGNCLKTRPLFSKTISPLIYESFVRDIILSAKFGGKYYYLHRLMDIIYPEYIKFFEELKDGEAIIPVPLSRKRLIERGYNQSSLIARYLSKKIRKPMLESFLIKTKETKPQSELNERDRFLNIKSAFVLKKEINFSKIILVDDIITTTATVSEISKVLKKGGINEIYIFSLCRATF